MKKSVQCLLLTVVLLSSAGCVAGDFCDVAKPMRPAHGSTVDYLYDNGEEQLADNMTAQNLYGQRNCSWRP